ncbi:MAG TPA: YARHG domain-containing protein [Ferruginibacter sp.]|jgi:hypothetical protein|nr:YARHG domain-containing protein [Ferruginibacter sp.]
MKNCWIVLLAGALFACNNSKDKTASEAKDDTPPPAAAAANPLDKLVGSFVGAFGDNKITLLITKVLKDTVEGRTVVGGNDRPFVGTLSEKEGVYNIAAREPGDDPNDGVFQFAIQLANPDLLTGSWKPYDKKKGEKMYTLQRKAFVYRVDVGDYPIASQRELKPEDVENMMKEDLITMRNEIYARHGYCFKKKDMRQYFEQLDWYVPDNVDVRDKLTDIEKKNIDIIKRYEKYAEEYGDEYGR